ncbi:WG repeat-containing protein [Aquiflexum lacus]|uniref:WG repeat-containing protein n=1 Tax=Aquiflexum lacus TaxID=2483805 RepID=UPI00189365E5|nr:WG repeat-containing protein [Aquiflexum lacus]
MNNRQYWVAACASTLLLFLTLTSSSAQTYEIYDQNLKLKSRVEYDEISILGESVRISSSNKELKLLSKELKPFVNLKAETVIGYHQPWIIIEGPNGKGVFHEYGEEVFLAEYDDIQTFYTLVLAKKGEQYWIYDHSTRNTALIGSFDHAIMARNGQVIAKTEQGDYLPLSKNPEHLYSEIKEINENFLLSKESSGYGLINREGEYVLQPIIDHIAHIEDNYFYAFDGNQYMLIRGREEKVDITYTSYHKITLEDGLMLEYIHGKLRRVMKNDGILLDQTGMDKVFRVGQKYYNVLLKDNRIGLLGSNGWIINPVDGNLETILPGNESLFPAKESNLFGFINQSGAWVIENRYEEVRNFTEGLAAVKINGAWEFLNKDGINITASAFDQVSDFNNSLALVKKNGKHNLIDQSGNILLNEGYDRITRAFENYYISENNNLFGLIAPNGKEIVEPKFQELRREDLNKILVRIGNKYGIIDERGDYLLPIYYKNILFDLGGNQILAEDQYQFLPSEPESKGPAPKKKKGE